MLLILIELIVLIELVLVVSFETLIIYQFTVKLPTDLLSIIIQAKYVISK